MASPTKKTRSRTSAPRDPRPVIRRYLRALAVPRPRGRPVDIDALRARRDAASDPLERLSLTQKILEVVPPPAVSLDELEGAFVEVAAAYAAEKGITWAAWRELGVSPAVLRRAGIPR